MNDDYLMEVGAVWRLARDATNKALDNHMRALKAKNKDAKMDKLGFDVVLYTDDPNAATILCTTADLADICGVSGVDRIHIVGNSFPEAAAEAVRQDPEHPRIAALLYIASGQKCPRCRKYTVADDGPLCQRCDTVVAEWDAKNG